MRYDDVIKKSRGEIPPLSGLCNPLIVGTRRCVSFAMHSRCRGGFTSADLL